MAEKWLVIDAHTHFLPEEVTAKAGISSDGPEGGVRMIPYRKIHDIEGTLRIMEGAGVDMAVLNLSASSPKGLEVCKAINEGYARIGRTYPGKFILCGHVPLQSGRGIIEEVERCINELGLQGMSLVSSFPEVTLDSPELWPIYEKIDQLGVPIVIHPTIRFPLWGGGKKYELRSTVSREYEIAKAVVEIMYGVLKDFPDLKFLLPHYGGGMPGLKARLRAWFEPEGWDIPDEIKACPKTPRELHELGLSKAFDDLFDKLYFDMAGAGAGWIPMIKAALLTIRTDRICFGTDYPFDIHNAEDIRSFIDNIKQLDIPETDVRLMLGENIKNLFKF